MKKSTSGDKKATPVYSIDAFGPKAGWNDFYIEKFRDHVDAHPFVGKPHKHDFYFILFLLNGGGNHTIDFMSHPMSADSIYLMTPGQVHTWNLTAKTDGYVVFFTKEFYQMQLIESNLLEFPFYHSIAASPVIHNVQRDPIDFIFKRMLKEYTTTAQPPLRLLRAYLDVLLLETAKYYRAAGTGTTHAVTYKLRKLEKLIDEHFITHRRPADYAEMMNLAPTYLNSICKINLGKTLTDLIQSRTILEAKRLLAYSDLHVNELADKLGFADASYFSRWFGKYAGCKPEEFRASQLSEQ
jgi:AraC family transcriptional regulator, transcriptional activator of pobA